MTTRVGDSIYQNVGVTFSRHLSAGAGVMATEEDWDTEGANALLENVKEAQSTAANIGLDIPTAEHKSDNAAGTSGGGGAVGSNKARMTSGTDMGDPSEGKVIIPRRRAEPHAKDASTDTVEGGETVEKIIIPRKAAVAAASASLAGFAGEDDGNWLYSSELGTKNYWDRHYELERDSYNYFGDPGEVWFGRGTVAKICNAIVGLVGEQRDVTVLDVGCGNGYSLIELYKLGFTRLFGTDYSPAALELARSIIEKEEIEAGRIQYAVDDIFASSLPAEWNGVPPFDIVMDKGTFDAICLDPTHASRDARTARQTAFCEAIKRLLKPTGYFVLTSCNMTENDLLRIFSDHFSKHSGIPYSTIRFGGTAGQAQTTVVFTPKA